jgi:hypothetical protein
VIRSVYTDEIVRWYIPTVSPTELCRRYIQTGSPTELCCRYIPTELKTELFPSVRITDEKISSVIPLVFAGFLVMMDCILLMTITRPISKEHMAKNCAFI